MVTTYINLTGYRVVTSGYPFIFMRLCFKSNSSNQR